MATAKAKKKEKEQEKNDELSYEKMTKDVQDLIQNEFIPWRAELKKYWPAMDKMMDAWEFYKSEKEKSSSKVSLNTPFAIIESMVARSNETSIKVSAEATGLNGLQEVEEYIASTVKSALEDRDIERIFGTFRKRKEMHFRDYLVIGNSFSEDQYAYRTQVANGVKKVIADNPVTEPLSYKSVIFNPAYYADNSPVYWVEKHTTWKDLKANELKEEDGKSRGLYTNLDALKTVCDKSGKLIDAEDEKVIQNGSKVSKKVEPIKLLIRWEGPRMKVFADEKILIRDAVDPMKTGHHNLKISMNYKKTGRPYAYGEIDAIYKIARAQDTIVNQSIVAVNKYLDQGYTYDPDDRHINVDQIMDVLEYGGVAPAKKDSLNPVNRVLPPSQAFQTIETLQQAEERTARYSAYASGVTNQSTDQTKGTASGINSLIKASEPNYQIKLDDLRDSYYIPIASDYLQMIANLMGENDVRYSKLKGKKPMWVKATKNLLLGNLDVNELLKCGVIKQKDYDKFITDESTGQKIPELAKKVLFDVDWLISVTLDNQAENDKIEKTQQKQAWFEQGLSYGLPMDAKKFHSDLGVDVDIEDPEQYYLQVDNPEGGQDMPDQTSQDQSGQQVDGQGQTAQQTQPEPQPKPMKSPTETLNYKDAPEDIKRQIEAQAGLQPSELPPKEVVDTQHQILIDHAKSSGQEVPPMPMEQPVQPVGPQRPNNKMM